MRHATSGMPICRKELEPNYADMSPLAHKLKGLS